MVTKLRRNRLLYLLLLLIPATLGAFMLRYVMQFYEEDAFWCLQMAAATGAAALLLCIALGFFDGQDGGGRKRADIEWHLCVVGIWLWQLSGSAAAYWFYGGFLWNMGIQYPEMDLPATFTLLIMPFAYGAVYSITALIRLARAGVSSHSLLVRIYRILVRQQGIRGRVFLELMLGMLLSMGGAAAVIVLCDIRGAELKALPLAGAMLEQAVVIALILLRRHSVSGDMERLEAYIWELDENNLSAGNPLSEKSALYETGERLAHIGEAMKESIESRIANEKLKVDLITNVSHDLKTPLTSMIGYGEMLAAMELPEEAGECVGKLNHKSAYLYEMVEEIFELSKTSSGNTKMDCVRLDIGRLLEQTLGEMDERIMQSGISIKREFAPLGTMVRADGAHMHRVFQNLIDNALKYACTGTRIFINVQQTMDRERMARVRITNTASYEMNFTPEEITERFVRGDKARSGEGSGIGLAIAKTYTEACGGAFHIEIEGDVFSAVVVLPLDLEAESEAETGL